MMEKEISETYSLNLKILSEDFYIDEKAEPEFIYAYTFMSDDDADKEIERKALIDEIDKNGCDIYKVIYLNKGNFSLSDSIINVR